jgi:hypothetical protein
MNITIQKRIIGKDLKGEGMGLMMQKIKAAHHPEEFNNEPTSMTPGVKKLGFNF